MCCCGYYYYCWYFSSFYSWVSWRIRTFSTVIIIFSRSIEIIGWSKLSAQRSYFREVELTHLTSMIIEESWLLRHLVSLLFAWGPFDSRRSCKFISCLYRLSLCRHHWWFWISPWTFPFEHQDIYPN